MGGLSSCEICDVFLTLVEDKFACEFVNVGSEYPSRLNHFGFKPSSVSMPHVNLYESGTVAPSAAP